MESENEITQIIRKSVNDGTILGMKHALLVLNELINTRVKLGYPEYITRNELNVFMNEYIRLEEEKNKS